MFPSKIIMLHRSFDPALCKKDPNVSDCYKGFDQRTHENTCSSATSREFVDAKERQQRAPNRRSGTQSRARNRHRRVPGEEKTYREAKIKSPDSPPQQKNALGGPDLLFYEPAYTRRHNPNFSLKDIEPAVPEASESTC